MDSILNYARRITDDLSRLLTLNADDRLRVDSTTEVESGSSLGAAVNGSVTLFNNVRMDTTTIRNSAVFDVEDWAGMWVDVYVDSTLTPTNLRLIAQFGDGTGNWQDFLEGFWSTVYWEDQDTAGGIYESLNLPCGGRRNVRFRLVSTGSDALNYFDVTVKVRPYRPAMSMAHA